MYLEEKIDILIKKVEFLQSTIDEISKENKAISRAPTLSRETKYSDIDRIIRFPELAKLTGMSRSTIWRREKQGEFPSPVKIGKRCVGWKKSEIKNWMNSKN